MKIKTFVYFSVLFLFPIVVWFFTNQYYQKIINSLKQEKTNCEISGKLTDAYLLTQKNKVLASVNKSLLFYSAKAEKISVNEWRVKITLDGAEDGAADAADLRLDFGDNLEITEIKNGSAFPLYPRKITAGNYILITGLASIANNKFVLGRPKNLFAEIIIKDKTNTPLPFKLILNKNDTKIYLDGESVFDDKSTFSQIVLP